jgi:hypothetical protein
MGERRALECERMELAILAARVGLGGTDLVEKALIDDPPEPRGIQPIQIHACNHSAAAALYELSYQFGRLSTPNRLDMVESGGPYPALKPGADVHEVDVAENDSSETLRPQRANSHSSRRSISGQLLPIARRSIPTASAWNWIMPTRVAWKRTRPVIESWKLISLVMRKPAPVARCRARALSLPPDHIIAYLAIILFGH